MHLVSFGSRINFQQSIVQFLLRSFLWQYGDLFSFYFKVHMAQLKHLQYFSDSAATRYFTYKLFSGYLTLVFDGYIVPPGNLPHHGLYIGMVELEQSILPGDRSEHGR